MTGEKKAGTDRHQPQEPKDDTGNHTHAVGTPHPAISSRSLLAYAVNLATSGVLVFPCTADKRPLTCHGFQDASADPEQVGAWWGEWPHALIGIPTGQRTRLLVLDIDRKNGKDGYKSLQALGFLLPDTRTHRTMSGGEHRLFLLPEGASIKSSVNKLGPGLDIRADGGYIIWWPCLGLSVEHPNIYAEVPAALLERLTSVTLLSEQQLAGARQVDARTITELRSALLHMRSDEYQLWAEMGLALHELGDAGRGLWLEWSATSEKFDSKQAAKKWNELRGSRSGYEAVFHAAQARGWVNPSSNAAQISSSTSPGNGSTSFEFRTPRDVLRRSIPQPFELDEAPSPIANFADAFSRATGFDQSGAIVAATTAASAVIDDRYLLEVRRGSAWFQSARQWAFLCASASGGKSPVIRPATDPIKKIHAESYAAWQIENADLDEKDKPPLPALYTSDATVPALSERLKDNPRGLLMLTEEFASWIGAIDSAGRGDAAKNRGDWLQLYDGGPHQIDRIGRGYVYVPNWGASVLAACTPDGLAKQMKDMPEDGLIQRFVPCIMQRPNLDADGDCTAALGMWENWLRWAYQFTSRPETAVCVRFGHEAQGLFDAEVKAQRKLVIATEEFAPAYASHLGKHAGMLARVALIFHVFSGTTPTAEVTAGTMDIAIRYMQRVRKHAWSLYSSILTSAPAYELAQALARSIVAADQPMPTAGRDWMTQHCAAFKKADDRLRREAVQMLEDADWLEAHPGVRGYGGWPSKYSVHPKVFQLFAREGEQWRARRAAVKDAIGES